jgi:hypothetical protein
MSKKLTRELISLKVKSDRLESIRKLNLWGSNLEDISIIAEMPSLEIVSLSVNKIRTLKPFSNLQNLKELYLRKNLISNLNEIKHLTECDNLTKLWLKENPICDNPNYREVIICVLPQVQNLDDIEITDEERERAEKKLSGNYDEEEDNEQENKIEQNEREEEKYSPKKNFSNEKNRGGEYAQSNARGIGEDEKFHENHENKNKINKQMKKNINKYDDEENDDYIQNNKKIQEQKGNYRHNYYDNYDERPIGGAGKMARNNNYKKAMTNDDIQYENKFRNKYENKYEDEYKENKPKEKKKGNSNVLNVVINLLKELSTNELQIVKREIDRINGY